MRILIAEDDNVLAGVIVEALSEEGYEPTRAATQEDAQRLAEEQAWDVIILDGFGSSYTEAGPRELALLASFTRHAPVILTTGRSWSRDIDPAKLGLAAVLPKPYDLGDLLDVIGRAASARDTVA